MGRFAGKSGCSWGVLQLGSSQITPFAAVRKGWRNLYIKSKEEGEPSVFLFFISLSSNICFEGSAGQLINWSYK